MKTSNKVLMSQARGSLKGKWRLGVKVTLLYFLINLILRFIPLIGPLASFIMAGPFMLGFAVFYLSLSRNQNPIYTKMFEGFNTWVRAFKAYLLVFIYTLLWTLLFIIPGIIAAFSYALTYYIIADDKAIGVNAAIDRSKFLMKGNKWKLFFLELRFLGWVLLCIPTLGIGFLWLTPYVQVSMAKFYDDVKKSKEGELPEVVAVPVAA